MRNNVQCGGANVDRTTGSANHAAEERGLVTLQADSGLQIRKRKEKQT